MQVDLIFLGTQATVADHALAHIPLSGDITDDEDINAKDGAPDWWQSFEMHKLVYCI